MPEEVANEMRCLPAGAFKQIDPKNAPADLRGFVRKNGNWLEECPRKKGATNRSKQVSY